MNVNVGGADKVIRIIAGIALVSLFFVLKGDARWLGLIGVVALATGLVGYCPLYSVLRFSTCAKTRHA